jgi:lipoprotein-anchoring transpeptidase ErfK/SrfK
VGVTTTEFDQFAATLEAETRSLTKPTTETAQLARIGAEDQKVKDATTAQVAAVNAFNAARDAARGQLGRAQSLLGQAKAIPVLKIQANDAAIALLAAQVGQATTTAQFQDLAAQLRSQADQLSIMLTTRQTAYALRDVAQARLQKAVAAGLDLSAETVQLAAASTALDAAGDQTGLSAAKDQVQAAKNAIDVKYNLATYGPGKVIVVSLQRQEMEVMQDGVIVLDTLVTTGRPALPTPAGNWTVMSKQSPYEMISPWPKGSPYYYNPSWVTWVMLFHEGGYFIHDAPWRTHYGPGSDSEFGGTHGCINVPHNQMSWLWNWTPVGTRVDVIAGDF